MSTMCNHIFMIVKQQDNCLDFSTFYNLGIRFRVCVQVQVMLSFTNQYKLNLHQEEGGREGIEFPTIRQNYSKWSVHPGKAFIEAFSVTLFCLLNLLSTLLHVSLYQRPSCPDYISVSSAFMYSANRVALAGDHKEWHL